MPHVPQPGHSRRTHGRVARRSHSHGGYLPPLQGAEALVDQDVIDGVVGPGDIPPGTIDGDGALIPGSLSSTPFADTIRPVGIVDVLPTLPDPEYPVGSLVVLTTDIKVYRNDADVWVKELDGLDLIADTVTAGAIAAGAVGATEIAAQAVHVGHMMGQPVNLVPNPSFEFLGAGTIDTPGSDIPGWTISANAQVTDDVTAVSGVNTLKMTQPGTPANLVEEHDRVAVAAGRRYRLSARVRGDAGNSATVTANLRVRFFDAAGAQISSTVVASTTTTIGTSTTFQRISGVIVADAVAAFAAVAPCCPSSGASAGDDLFWDDVEFYLLDQDVSHSGGDVEITSDGITIRGGKLTLEDEFSETVAVASGFEGGWLDMIRTGLYNGSLDGPLGAIALGRTADLPYWTVSDFGSPTATMTTDSAYKGGKKIRVTFSATSDQISFVSDLVAITAGESYALVLQIGMNSVGSSFVNVSASIGYYDKSETFISSTALMSVDNIFGSGSLAPTNMDGRSALGLRIGNYSLLSTANGRAPLNAAFANVVITVGEQTAHSASNWVDIGAVALVPAMEGTPPQMHVASNLTTLTTTRDVVVGMTSLGIEKGRYEISGVFDFDVQTASAGVVCVAEVDMVDPVIEVTTSSAADDIIDTVEPHGLVAGDRFEFTSLSGGAGLDVSETYYVIASGLGSTTFKLSLTLGGAAVNFTTDITSGTWGGKRVTLDGAALFKSNAAPGRATVYQQWEVTVEAESMNAFLFFMAYKTGAGGTMVLNALHSSAWIKPIP